MASVNSVNSSLTMDPDKAAQKLQDLNTDFKTVVSSINSMVTDLFDLQANFYSPNGKDTTLIYEECGKNLGVISGATNGLYPAVKEVHQWASAVDGYVQDVIKNYSDNNPYTN